MHLKLLLPLSPHYKNGMLFLMIGLLFPSSTVAEPGVKTAMREFSGVDTEDPSLANTTTARPSYTLLPSYEIPFGQGDGDTPFLYKKQPCTRTEEEIFELEVVRGGCRQDIIDLMNEAIHHVLFTCVPPNPIFPPQKVYDMITQNLDKLILDNMSIKNIADIVALAFETSCSAAGPPGVIVGSIGKPIARKMAILIMKQGCRAVGCCIPGPNDLSCCTEA